MSIDYSSLSENEYDEYTHDRSKGGWKDLTYLESKGLVENLKQMFGFYEDYNCSQHNINFPDPKEVIDKIHSAGGYAILAHPGEYIKNTPCTKITDILNKFAEHGIDGVECYYPRHSTDITNTCLDWCNKRDMNITGGSDYHGSFAGNPINSIRISKKQIKLHDLIT